MTPRAGGAIPARSHSRSNADEPEGLFPDIPEAKKRKFILVEDNVRGSRLRVRVTLDGVDTDEIPDSFRKGASVYPRSYFPREMQSPPPSATGSRFFSDDLSDDGIQETEGRDTSHHRAPKPVGEVVKVTMAEGHDGEATIPRTRNSRRGKEVRLNDLAYRMAWLQSRVFAGRTVFLQRARECGHVAVEDMIADHGSQWTVTATRRGPPSKAPCRTSRPLLLFTKRAPASEGGTIGGSEARRAMTEDQTNGPVCSVVTDVSCFLDRILFPLGRHPPRGSNNEASVSAKASDGRWLAMRTDFLDSVSVHTFFLVEVDGLKPRTRYVVLYIRGWPLNGRWREVDRCNSTGWAWGLSGQNAKTEEKKKHFLPRGFSRTPAAARLVPSRPSLRVVAILYLVRVRGQVEARSRLATGRPSRSYRYLADLSGSARGILGTWRQV